MPRAHHVLWILARNATGITMRFAYVRFDGNVVRTILGTTTTATTMTMTMTMTTTTTTTKEIFSFVLRCDAKLRLLAIRDLARFCAFPASRVV